MSERSGIHLTGTDSGWPVGSDEEPAPHKDGSGTDTLPKAQSIAGGSVTASEEVETVEQSGGATGTTFTLTFSGQTTSGLALNASAAAVLAALEALSNIAVGDVAVSGPAGGPYVITFLEAGAYGDTNVTQITGDGVGVNEIQTLTASGAPAGNDFKLTYNGQQTAAITYDASGHHPTATEVRDALRALSNVPDTDLTAGGGPLDGTPVTISFSGTLAESDVNALVSDDANVVVSTGTPGKTGPTFVITTGAQGS